MLCKEQPSPLNSPPQAVPLCCARLRHYRKNYAYLGS